MIVTMMLMKSILNYYLIVYLKIILIPFAGYKLLYCKVSIGTEKLYAKVYYFITLGFYIYISLTDDWVFK